MYCARDDCDDKRGREILKGDQYVQVGVNGSPKTYYHPYCWAAIRLQCHKLERNADLARLN